MNNADNDHMPFKERPIYNIGAVERLTDISPATLRVWERRYEFPKPERTSGGHRIYSEEEVEKLQWVKARIDEGMQTSQAIKALQTLGREGRLTNAIISSEPYPVLSPEAENPSLDVFDEQLSEALLAKDMNAADRILGRVMALYPLEELILRVIRPTLGTIGMQWLEGKISIADEHMATNYLRHRLIMWMETGPPPYPVSPTILACAPNEWHEGSLLMLGVLLRRRRWPVQYLGQALPLEDLATFVRDAHPPAVALVAMREETAEALVEWPKWLPEAAKTGHPLITYGGLVFTEQPEWRQRVPGIFLGSMLCEGVKTLDQLLQDRTGMKSPES
jgi:DNA-binding transcriptional MerR regulator